jgi:hypothetical protein
MRRRTAVMKCSIKKCNVRKCLAVIVVTGGLVAVGLAAKRQSAGDKATSSPTVWQKLQEMMEAMPEDFPPRVMCNDIAAIRDNTERIRELLETGGAESEAE